MCQVYPLKPWYYLFPFHLPNKRAQLSKCTVLPNKHVVRRTVVAN